jgi:hypothetical protein
MSPEERDLAYIWDMLEYANKVVEMMAGQSQHDWNNNMTLRLGIGSISSARLAPNNLPCGRRYRAGVRKASRHRPP